MSLYTVTRKEVVTAHYTVEAQSDMDASAIVARGEAGDAELLEFEYAISDSCETLPA
jgi:hypothetical protein